MLSLRTILNQNPQSGTPLGNACFKIRLSIQSKGKGKSGGARAITHIVSVNEDNGVIYLLAVYDKSYRDTIDTRELNQLLKQIK